MRLRISALSSPRSRRSLRSHANRQASVSANTNFTKLCPPEMRMPAYTRLSGVFARVSVSRDFGSAGL